MRGKSRKGLSALCIWFYCYIRSLIISAMVPVSLTALWFSLCPQSEEQVEEASLPAVVSSPVISRRRRGCRLQTPSRWLHVTYHYAAWCDAQRERSRYLFPKIHLDQYSCLRNPRVQTLAYTARNPWVQTLAGTALIFINTASFSLHTDRLKADSSCAVNSNRIVFFVVCRNRSIHLLYAETGQFTFCMQKKGQFSWYNIKTGQFSNYEIETGQFICCTLNLECSVAVQRNRAVHVLRTETEQFTCCRQKQGSLVFRNGSFHKSCNLAK